MPKRDDYINISYDEMSYEEKLEAVRAIRESRVAPPKNLKPKTRKRQVDAASKLSKMLASMTPAQQAEFLAKFGVDKDG